MSEIGDDGWTDEQADALVAALVDALVRAEVEAARAAQPKDGLRCKIAYVADGTSMPWRVEIWRASTVEENVAALVSVEWETTRERAEEWARLTAEPEWIDL